MDWGATAWPQPGSAAHVNISFLQVERDERSDEESPAEDKEEEEEEEPEEEGECSWEQRKGALNSKLASLANNCVLNNLTQQRRMNSRLPKAR